MSDQVPGSLKVPRIDGRNLINVAGAGITSINGDGQAAQTFQLAGPGAFTIAAPGIQRLTLNPFQGPGAPGFVPDSAGNPVNDYLAADGTWRPIGAAAGITSINGDPTQAQLLTVSPTTPATFSNPVAGTQMLDIAVFDGVNMPGYVPDPGAGSVERFLSAGGGFASAIRRINGDESVSQTIQVGTPLGIATVAGVTTINLVPNLINTDAIATNLTNDTLTTICTFTVGVGGKGKFAVYGYVGFAATSDPGPCGAVIEQNSAVVASCHCPIIVDISQGSVVHVSGFVDAADGDVITLRAIQKTGNTLAIALGTGVSSLMIVRIGTKL